MINTPEKLKKINYYAHIQDIRKEPLSDAQLQELDAIVNILQILYTDKVGSPVSDSTYDILQEMLVNMGIPRLTGSVEINDSKKIGHVYKQLRGSLDKVYYLTKDEPRVNKSREYLDEWLQRTSDRYESITHRHLDFNMVKIICTCKMDGVSACMESDNVGNITWISRGDTTNNRASDATHILKIFNDVFYEGEACGQKFECMVTEEDKDQINDLLKGTDLKYRNSRQVVISTMNTNEPDFKVDYLYPVPLRIIHPGEDIESIHPKYMEKFPTLICNFGDRELIRKFANSHRYVNVNGKHLRTDGCVLTILDKNIQRVLGRVKDVNKFEVAYKFTEEEAITKVKDVEFYVSEFGYVTPVLVVNDVILKGNTINHISLSNKERFDELALCYGDEVKVSYDIIPYARVTKDCKCQPNGRKIEFVKRCPKCKELLDLDTNIVQCKNPRCPSRIVGRIMNYCDGVRIKNIGYQTLDTLYSVGLLPDGIRSLYTLKKHKREIEDLPGFGKLKTQKIIAEIEAKRRLKDYEFFGSIGVEGLSNRTFQQIFSNIKYSEFLDFLRLKNFDLLRVKLIAISGIGDSKANDFINFIKDKETRKELEKMLNEVILHETYAEGNTLNGIVVFTGCRPSDALVEELANMGYGATDNWTVNAKCLVIPFTGFTSTKVAKAESKNIPIIKIDNLIGYLRNRR